MRLDQVVQRCAAILVLTIEVSAILHAQGHSSMVLLLGEQDECVSLEWIKCRVDRKACLDLV